jgi:aminomethyltransferase
VKRKLVGVEIEGARLEFNMTRWPVRAGGSHVGQITSAIYSPRFKQNIGYAMVPVAQGMPGTQLVIQTPDGERKAKVVQMPFVDPTKSIAKG